MSALRPNQGWAPDPIEATTPVLAIGHVYSIPSESSSDLMSWLVSNSSKPSSGFSWILLRILTNQSENSGSLAESNSSRLSSLRSEDGLSNARTRLVIVNKTKLRNNTRKNSMRYLKFTKGPKKKETKVIFLFVSTSTWYLFSFNYLS